MTIPDQERPEMDQSISTKEIAFDYIKSHDFKVVWADGAIGGVTPNGLVHFAVYAERPAIPRRQVHTLEPLDDTLSKLGEEILEKRISRGSIVREMSCDVFLTSQTAEHLAKWLLQQAERSNKQKQEIKK